MPASMRVCPSCGGLRVKPIFKPRASPGWVSRCEHCRMVYIPSLEDPHALIFDGPVLRDQGQDALLSSANLADVQGCWELKDIARKEAETHHLRRDALLVLDRLETHLAAAGSGRRLLDFGSGFGFFLAAAKDLGWETYGLEPLPACAIYARAKFGLRITTDTLRETTFPPDFFDVVTANQVFEHLPDPRTDLRILSKSIRPGGLIFIEVPCWDTWTMALLRANHRHFVQDHINFFSRKTLTSLLKKFGFQILETFHPLRVMSLQHLYEAWVARMLPARAARLGERLVRLESLGEKRISLYAGDNLAVIAQKT